jgi:hypothetical protein
MKPTLMLLTALMLASQSAAHTDDELVVYPPVPGLTASEHYQVRVLHRGNENFKTGDTNHDGFIETPNIDRAARECLLFRNAFEGKAKAKSQAANP